jgi:hypothetical protein
MTQEYTPASLEEILIDYVHRKDDTETTQEATVDEFRRWLADHDAKIRAEAWDEGWDQGNDHGEEGRHDQQNCKSCNPYSNPYLIRADEYGKVQQ